MFSVTSPVVNANFRKSLVESHFIKLNWTNITSCVLRVKISIFEQDIPIRIGPLAVIQSNKKEVSVVLIFLSLTSHFNDSTVNINYSNNKQNKHFSKPKHTF